MASVTYYVALPFTRNQDGELVALEARECHSRNAALSAARSLQKEHGGAIAFSRTGDPDVGEFKDAEIIERIGDTPTDLSELL